MIQDDKEKDDLIAKLQKEIEDLKRKEAVIRWKQPEYHRYKYEAVSSKQQLVEMDKILSKFLKETRSSRYIIGTSLYDILRHPLHGTGPAKRIANV